MACRRWCRIRFGPLVRGRGTCSAPSIQHTALPMRLTLSLVSERATSRRRLRHGSVAPRQRRPMLLVPGEPCAERPGGRCGHALEGLFVSLMLRALLSPRGPLPRASSPFWRYPDSLRSIGRCPCGCMASDACGRYAPLLHRSTDRRPHPRTTGRRENPTGSCCSSRGRRISLRVDPGHCCEWPRWLPSPLTQVRFHF